MSAALVVERHPDAGQFLAAAQDWLLESEAENNLLLGIAQNWRGRESTPPHPYWATVRRAGRVVACACRTPPSRLVLSRLPIEAVAAVADDVHAACGSLNGATGPAAEVEAFANAWTTRHGGSCSMQMRLRLHELTHVAYTSPVAAGSLRKAAATDVALACDWIDAYVRDTGLQAAADEYAQRLIERGQLFLWIDGSARAMLAATRCTASGCSINTVYTPPQYRRRGYATAAVAALSDSLLKSGRRFCCLYTDAANPTSNSIYAKIGYRPIRDDLEISLEP